MGGVPLYRLAQFALALFLALGPTLMVEAGSAALSVPRAPSEDLDDERPTELAAPSARQRAAQPKRAPQRYASTPNVPLTAERAPKRTVNNSRPTSLDPLGSRLRC